MNLLFLTHRLPCPPDRGCKLRSAAILHGLARRHDVWCAGFLDAGRDAQSQSEAERSLMSLRHICRGVLALPFNSLWAGYKALGGLVAGGTATEGYFASRALADGVRQWSQQITFDAVFAFSSGIAPLALAVPAARRVLCMDDLDSRKWQELTQRARWPMRLIYDTEARRLARRELEWIDQFDATLMISRREAELVADSRLRAKVHVFPPILPSAPSMMTTSSFGQDGPAQNPSPACPGLGGENLEYDNGDVAKTGPVVGFVGAMDYEPNIDAACWLAHDIWPRVRQSCPEAELWIVGRSPTQAVRDLAADPSVTVTGTVPGVEDYFRRMRVHVAPLRIARGVQIKVIAAMAAGRPCVVTSGVADGIAARGGRELIVADSPAVFAKCVTDLLDHPERAAAVGRAGRRFVDRLQPEQAIRRLEALLTLDQNPKRDDADSICSLSEPAVSSQECVAIS